MGGRGEQAYAGAVVDPAQDAEPGRSAPGSPGSTRPRDPQQAPAALITDAREASSRELSDRVRRYTVTMAFRMVCFLSMIFVEGWPRWVLLACAVFLPYVAVVAANQSDQRSRTGTVCPGAPEPAPQLPVGGSPVVLTGEVVEGQVQQDRDDREGRVA